MKLVTAADVRRWHEEAATYTELGHTLGATRVDPHYLSEVVGLPLHLRFVIEHLAAELEDDVPKSAFDSLPFYSLCKGLFLPLSGMGPEKVRRVFGLEGEEPPTAKDKEALLQRFLDKECGLSLEQKLSCVLGDPFRGKRSQFQRDSLVRLLMSAQLTSRRKLLDRLAVVGDIAVVFAESRAELSVAPRLTTTEVLETLRLLRKATREMRFELLRSVLVRMGKLEAFFLAKLLLRKAGFGFDYQGPLLARAMADRYGASPDQVSHAMALRETFEVARVLEEEGAEGLRRIQLQPLVPVRPALAGGAADDVERFPVWVERKYDGIRFMLHKSTDATGAMLSGAYTRRRGDWLELVPGLDATIKSFPARSMIVDGELYGTVLDSAGGVRPATVYEVYYALQGERPQPITLKFAAFDLLYVDGRDLTGLPLRERRAQLSARLGPLSGMQLPVPVTVAEGQLAQDGGDIKRLYQHFRSQGYEGVITKDLARPYQLATRDPTWAKKKPEITLDLVLLAGVFSVTSKENAALFGSYVIGARRDDGSFEDVGDVAGVDRVRDQELQQEIMREGLLTGRRIERDSMSGKRPGVELVPHVVATVKFDGITKDFTTGRLALRDPKIAYIRSDKGPADADKLSAIDELFLKQRMT
jgi:DNA ligase-1